MAALTAVLFFGALTLWAPFSIDQSIFAYGARTILAHGVLYVDFWDIKPPGIFLFFSLGGWLFGLDELGIHLLELFWMLGAALTLTWIAHRALQSAVAAVLAPVASIGVYFLFAEGQHRTQVEALAALPVALALAAAVILAERPGSRAASLLLGTATGVLGALKLVYLGLPASFAFLAAVEIGRRHKKRALFFLPRIAAWAFLGLLLVGLPIWFYFVAHGAVGELVWTTLGYPLETLRDVAQAPASRLQGSLVWTLRIYLPWLPLVALGLFSALRLEPRALGLGIVAYLACGMILIYIQKASWWQYHLVLLFPPLGLLAALGLDRLIRFFRSRRKLAPVGILVATLLLVPPLGSIVRRSAAWAGRLARAHQLETDAPLAVRLDWEYLQIWDATRPLREAESPGSVYTLGDPRVLWLSRRSQSIAVHGHGWEHLPRRMWARLPGELMAAEPEYVFVNGYNWSVLERRSPELIDYLETHYRPSVGLAGGRLLGRIR